MEKKQTEFCKVESRDIFCVFSCIGECGYLELYIVMVWHIEVVLSLEQINVLEAAETRIQSIDKKEEKNRIHVPVKDLC